jgi:hypothetical protein
MKEFTGAKEFFMGAIFSVLVSFFLLPVFASSNNRGLPKTSKKW